MNFKKILSRVLLIFCLWVILSSTSTAIAAPLEEYEIKAAFLYQFSKFVEWPELTSQESFTICIFGSNPFSKFIEDLETSEMKSKKVRVHLVTGTDPMDSCQILFIPRNEHKAAGIVQKIIPKRILTVGETENFLAAGGIINFIKQGNKIRFEINQKQAEASGIKISSKLLSVAIKVIT